jgi:hypothetical protein
MEVLLDRTITPSELPIPAAPSRTVEVDEQAARRSLREQIARLECQLGAALASASPGLALEVAVPAHGGARLLALGELEALRDAMAQRLREAGAALAAHAERHRRNRELVERMMLEPARYRFARVSREDIGEGGCGGWEVRPRLGLIGMLAGWWQVKLSSGCPLAMPYYHRRPPRPWGRNARIELVATALVIVIVVGVLALFLFVYHDVPLRTS